MAEDDDELRRARGRAGLSRAEVADAVAAHVVEHTGREPGVDAHYVAKLERGVIRWPNADYRGALRRVLGAPTDASLGFRASSDPMAVARTRPEIAERVEHAVRHPRRVDLSAAAARRCCYCGVRGRSFRLADAARRGEETAP